MMKFLFLNLITILMVSSNLVAGSACVKIVKEMDKKAFSDDYKKIAWLSYRHKKKLDYIQRSYAIMERIKNETANSKFSGGNLVFKTISIPTVEMAAAEANIITEINKVNLALLELLVYHSIDTEIHNIFKNIEAQGK